MNKSLLCYLILALVLLVNFALPQEVSAQTMKMDLNGITMPFCRTFQADSLAIATTAYQSITVPAGAAEVTIWATALCAVNETDTGVAAILPANHAIRMSVADVPTLYARRTATATATVLYLLWHKL